MKAAHSPRLSRGVCGWGLQERDLDTISAEGNASVRANTVSINLNLRAGWYVNCDWLSQISF